MRKVKGISIIEYLLWILLFAMLVIIDNARSIGFMGDWKNGNLSYGVGAVVFGVIILHYGLEKCKKIGIILYSILCIALLINCRFFFFYIPGLYYGQCLMLVLNIWLGGICAFLFIKEICEKGKKVFDGKNLLLFVPFILFYIFAGISRYHGDKPFYLLIVFAFFYLISFTKEEMEVLYSRMGTGVTLGFWILQTFAFGFRPFDVVRYTGLYYNCNVYAILCMVVVFLSLFKIYEMESRQKKVYLMLWLLNLLAVYSLLILSICRMAIFLTTLIVIVFFVHRTVFVTKQGMGICFKKMGITVLALILVFPLTFGAVRYLPTILRHPIWFGNEYFEKENKVMAGAVVNDENYVSFKEFAEICGGRIGALFWGNDNTYGEKEPEELVTDPDYEGKEYFLGEEYNSFEHRIGIALTYLVRINFRGHTAPEHNLWVMKHELIQHAHNIFVQMFYSYGIFAGIIFCIWVAFYLVFSLKYAADNKKSWFAYLPLCAFVIMIGYGITECVWEMSQITLMMFLFMQKPLLQLGDGEKAYLPIKDMGDRILAFVGLVILSPLFLILIIAIKLDSKGPVLFKQKRVGIHKTYFNILKFRTMRIDTPKDTPTHLLANPEQYITKVGRFLRKTSLDELPQIINILKGDMAIVGPRPALWNQYDLIEERDKYGANDVMPGLTGWAQINGRDELEIPVKAKLDGEYVEKLGLMMDLKCIFGTVGSVLKQKGVVEGGTGEMKRKESEK